MVKPEDKDSSEEDENMNSEQGASTAPAEPASFAEMMKRDAKLKAGINTAPSPAILNRKDKASEDTALQDWRVQDVDENEDPEDELFLPHSQNFHPNSIDHLDEQMRFIQRPQVEARTEQKSGQGSLLARPAKVVPTTPITNGRNHEDPSRNDNIPQGSPSKRRRTPNGHG
jgi:hypothetical protein